MPAESAEVNSVEEMHRLAGRVARGLVPGDVLLLSGELGSGKTTFVQGLAQALGVADSVTSPTFTIVGEYGVRGQGIVKKLVHVDLYRLADRAAARDPVVVEVLDQREIGERVTVIEWAEKLGGLELGRSRTISFRHGATVGSRLVTLEI